MPQRRIVLLGIGHTNAHVIHQWQRNPLPNCELVCISKFPAATYSGMLPGTLGLQFSENEMQIDLAALCARSGASLVIADTIGSDLETPALLFADHKPISFDALSIGVGSMPAGWECHNHVDSFIPTKPMQTFIARLDQQFHRLAGRSEIPLKLAVVGGGVASVEIALCLDQQLSKHAHHGEFSISIFTGNQSVAHGLQRRSIRRIERILQSRNISITAGNNVTEVAEDSLVAGDNLRHRADVVVWATGASAPPLLGKLNLQTDDRGFIATTSTLQSLSDPRVFAVGDSGTIVESPSPKAGVYAVRQCPILWHNLRALLGGTSMKTFKPQSDFLKLINTGDGKALLEYGFITTHARWCWKLKTWIDKRFVTAYQVDRDIHS
ncbi:NADH dehydrogenase-like protein YjlD [Rubripirellula tenax]|uniref:NADH dehydrogenase-like protein YjlD n=1 Tax=Rubripirellula tenax TaxID=2528015 RepID=A0A5C6E5M4_9BACT|nr:FAD-dependent oxidoreductase [Rubripirellula tenax]TWU42921.1 NADH dehydrogenase-like protein YjlD [Rubripirellula tenax]